VISMLDCKTQGVKGQIATRVEVFSLILAPLQPPSHLSYNTDHTLSL